MSAVNSAVSINPTTLRCLSEVNARQLNEIVRSKIDHLRCVIGANGMGLNQIRAKNLLSDEHIAPDCRDVATNPKTFSAEKIKGNTDGKLFGQRVYLIAATLLYKESLHFWTALQESMLSRGELELSESDLAPIKGLADTLSETIFKKVPMSEMFYEPRKRLCTIQALRQNGKPPKSLNEKMPLGLDLIQTAEGKQRNWGYVQKLVDDCKNNVLMLVTYSDDPERNEYEFLPSKFERVPPKNNNDVFLVHGTLILFEPKLIASIELMNKRVAKFKLIRNEEKRVIDDCIAKLQKRVEYNRALAQLPSSAPRQQVFTPALSYDAAMAVRKPKKGPKVEPAADDDSVEDITLPNTSAVERQQVELKDLDAYNTFRTVMGADKDPVSWNDVVHALKEIGFEITRAFSSNTWKFKWKTQAWLRDEKTIEELAGEFEPEETTVATTSMHLPHQGGLTTRGKLDTGRLSTFKKLLEESGFDLCSVTLKRKQ